MHPGGRTSSRRLPTVGLLVAVLASGLAVSSCDDGRERVVVYSPHGRDLLVAVEEAYEAQNPQVDVRWLDMGSQEVYDRVRSEKANPQADVWFGGPSTLFARGASEGLLEAYGAAWHEQVHPDLVDPEGRYAALYRTPTLIVFHRDAFARDEAPADWSDLLEERLADRIVIRDPLASGTMRTIFGYLISDSVRRTGSSDEGFDYLRGLDAATREYVHSPALLHQKLIRREGDASLWEMTDILGLIDGGAPLDFRFPESGTPVIADSVALVAGAPHPDTARAFLDWLGSEEALAVATAAFRLPALEGLDPASLPAWAERVQRELVPADVDWRMIEERGGEWMRTWDSEVRGQGK